MHVKTNGDEGAMLKDDDVSIEEEEKVVNRLNEEKGGRKGNKRNQPQ